MVALTVVFTLMIVLYVRVSTKGKIDFFSPMVAVGGYYFISILAGLTLIFTIDPLGLANDVSYRGIYRLSLFGFLSFYMGALYTNTVYNLKKCHVDGQIQLIGEESLLKSKSYGLCMKMLLGIGMISALFFFLRSGTVPLFATEKNEARMLTMEIPGNGYLLYLMLTMNYYIIMEYYRYVLNERSIRQNNKIAFWITTALVFNVYLLTGSRRFSLFLIVYILMVRNYAVKLIAYKKIMISTLAMIIFIVIFELFRESNQDTTQTFLITVVYRLIIYISNFTKIYELIPVDLPFQYGATYVMDFLTILPGKQIDYQTWLKDLTGLTFKGFGIPPTIVGDLYLNWGEIGVYIGMFLIGMLLQLTYTYLILEKRNMVNIIFYIIVFEASLKMITSGLSAQLFPIIFQIGLFSMIIIIIKILLPKTNRA